MVIILVHALALASQPLNLSGRLNVAASRNFFFDIGDVDVHLFHGIKDGLRQSAGFRGLAVKIKSIAGRAHGAEYQPRDNAAISPFLPSLHLYECAAHHSRMLSNGWVLRVAEIVGRGFFASRGVCSYSGSGFRNCRLRLWWSHSFFSHYELDERSIDS